MSYERWLPINYLIPDGQKLRKLLSAGNEWQLYALENGARALVSRLALSDKWISAGLLEPASLADLKFGRETYSVITSNKEQLLAPVTEFVSPETKADAMAFAVSLQQTRAVITDISMHDAVYVERLSRLLPTWTITEAVSDEQILGRWLTGGVSVSTSSFRRLTNLLGWLDQSDVQNIIRLAGLGEPSEEVLSRTRESKDKKTSPPVIKLNSKRRTRDDESASSGVNSKEFRLSGRPFLEEFFNEHIVDIILNEDRYRALGVEFPSAVVLHGPPGCGKTFAVERLIEFLDWPAYHIDSNSVGSPYIHETSRKVSEVFEKAMGDSPSVVVIDEMESFLSDRQLHQSTGLHHVEEVAEFLRRIPEAISRRVLVIAMTNRLEMIDPAILRRGRFDHVIEVGMPSKKEVSDLMTALLQKMPVEGEVTLEKAITTLEGRPLSDAAFAIREAGRLAARAGRESIDQQSLDTSIARLPSVPDEEKSRPIGFIWN